MRIDTDLTEEDIQRVKKYAEKHGLRRSRAYAEIIRRGLENSKV